MIALLAGKAATEIIFGEPDTGVNSDLRRAFDIVQRFSDHYCAYGFGYWEDRSSSPERLALREDRITADMETYYAKAKKILIDNKAFLERLAKRLIEKDTLIGSEIRKIKDAQSNE